MARRRRTKSPHYFINLTLSLAVLCVFSLTGVRVTGNSTAATTNPYGYADYCTLEDNITVIYGWGADPNATSFSQPSVTINAGGRAVTTPTNRAGYRDTAVNAWIDANRPGDPKPGTYGFRAPISGLYKGTRTTITGTVLNEGAGSSVILSINASGHTDGDTSKPFFAGNLIPEACLAVAPGSPAPPPTPPQPPQPPAPRPITPAPVSPTPGLAPATPQSLDSGKVTAGTLAAEVKAPVGSAATMRIKYGKNPLSLDLATPEQPVNGSEPIILITGLEPSSGYAYEVIRTDRNNRVTTSPISDFKTLGYAISVHFVDRQNQGLQGIPAKINIQNKEKQSDEDGNILFTDLPNGSHTINYTYRGKKYSKIITASPSIVSPADAAAAKVVTLDFTINLEEVVSGKSTPSEKQDEGINGLLVAVIIGLIALLLLIAGLLIRRRKLDQDYYYDSPPAAPLPEYQPMTPISSEPIVPRPRGAEHMGESLKDMVLRSMAEEAQRRADQDKK